MSIRKTPLQQAIIEAKEIEKVAYDSARKVLEETISPKIEQAVKESLMELEKEIGKEVLPVTEAVKIEVTPEGGITVTSDEVAEKLDNGVEASSETPNELEANTEISNTETPNTEINMEENMEEEMYEVEAGSNIPEAPTEAPAETPIDATTEAPTEVPTETPVETPVSSSPNPFDAIDQKLDAILNKLGTEETPSQGAEGEVEIVDDETAQAPTEAPAPVGTEAPAPVTEMGGVEEEDVVYELDGEEEGFVRETDGKMFDEMSDLEEIEIVDEEADAIEEDSFLKRRLAGQRGKIGEIPLGKVAPHSDHATSLKENKENKNITAQKESKLDELKQENESLKKTIKEYKESFVVLRKQINEVQVFNAKLAYANKLFINGGLKNEEKVRIAEEFDKVSTVEDAKKLYNNLLKEVSEVKTVKVAPEEKLKSVKPSVQQPSEKSQTLYESDEMKRMKQLAGIL